MLPVIRFNATHTSCSQRQMLRVFQVFEIFEIWICHIFEFFWPPKVTSTLSKEPTQYDGDANKNKVYLNINSYLYLLVNVILRLDGS